jgi:hypothetical protein
MNTTQRGMRKMALRNRMVPSRDVARKRGMFYGDPIDVSPAVVAEALNDPTATADVVADAIVEMSPSDEEAAARLQAYDSMSVVEKAAVTKVPPLAVWNSSIVVDPVLGRILAANLNYTLQKAMIDYPFSGFIKSGQLMAPGTLHLELTSLDLEPGAGYKTLPFFRFIISASTLNARPGGNYSIWLEGFSDSGAAISTPVYSFQRKLSNEALVGVFIPFSVIATRALPVLPMFGTDGVLPRTITIHVSGMTEDEVLTVTVPGYATAELREIATMYNLPAGIIM